MFFIRIYFNENLESSGLSQPVLDGLSKISECLGDTPIIHYSNLEDRSLTFISASSNGNKRIEIKKFDIQNYQGVVLSSQIEVSENAHSALNYEFGDIIRHAIIMDSNLDIRNVDVLQLVKDVESTLHPSI